MSERGEGDRERRGGRRKRTARNTPRLPDCPFCEKENPDHFPVSCPSVVCFQCRGLGHVAGMCDRATCSWCGKTGHFHAECPLMGGKSAKRQRPAATDTTVTVTETAPVSSSAVASTSSSAGSYADAAARRRPQPSSSASVPVSAPALSVSGYVQRMRDDFVGLVNSMSRVKSDLADLDKEEEALEAEYKRRKERLATRRRLLVTEQETTEQVSRNLEPMVAFLRTAGVQIPDEVIRGRLTPPDLPDQNQALVSVSVSESSATVSVSVSSVSSQKEAAVSVSESEEGEHGGGMTQGSAPASEPGSGLPKAEPISPVQGGDMTSVNTVSCVTGLGEPMEDQATEPEKEKEEEKEESQREGSSV